MNIHKFKQEQFDEANALVNILSCSFLQMCAHPLLDPTCSTLKSCCCSEKRVTMNIHKFKQEQFDEADALVNVSSCSFLQMCAHSWLDYLFNFEVIFDLEK